MSRTVMDYAIDKPDDFIKFIVDDFFAKEGFEAVNRKGEAVWRRGIGFLTAPQFIKIQFGGGHLHMEAWIQSFGEHSLDGFYGAIPKEQLRTKLNTLLGLLYQNVPIPNQQPAYAGAPGGAYPPAGPDSSAQPQPGTMPPPIPVAVHNPTGQSTLALVMGLVAIIGIYIPIVGVIAGIVAICAGIRGRKSTAKTMATVGMVLGIIFLVVAAALWLLNILSILIY